MRVRWILKVYGDWEDTEISRQTSSLADAVRGYRWDDITSIRVIDNDGLEKGWCETELFEAGRNAQLATNVADRCIWDSVEDSLQMLYKKLKKKKVKECIIL